MAFFKEMTIGKTVIMGKNTYLSLPEKFRPLPRRSNIVISSQAPFEEKEGLYWANSMDKALDICKNLDTKEIFIIGGGQIYESFLDLANTIYATEVEVDIQGDTFFPEINTQDWNSELINSFQKNERNEYGFKIIKYSRS